MYLRVYDGLRQLVSFSPGSRILLQVRGVRSAMEKSRKEGCAGVNVLACEQKNRWDGVIGEVGDVGPLSLHELCQARTFVYAALVQGVTFRVVASRASPGLGGY